MRTPQEMENFVREQLKSTDFMQAFNPTQMTEAFFPEYASQALSGNKVAIQKIVNSYRQKGIEAFGHTESARMQSFGYFATGIYWSGKL